MFFVRFGYLVPGGVLDGLDRGGFRLDQFYVRRMRRLAPAAPALLASTKVVSAFLLTRRGYPRYLPHLLRSLTFSTNFVLATDELLQRLSGLDSLRHIWSLAVVDHYYLVLPVVLTMISQGFRPASILTATECGISAYPSL